MTTATKIHLTGAVLEDAAEIALAGVMRGRSRLESGFGLDHLAVIYESAGAFALVGGAPQESPARDSMVSLASRGGLGDEDVVLLRRVVERHREVYADWMEGFLGDQGLWQEELDHLGAEVARAERVLAALGEGGPV